MESTDHPLQPSVVALDECVLLSGKGILELRGGGQRLRTRGCLFFALEDAVHIDLKTLAWSDPDVTARFEHNTVACRQSFIAFRLHDGPPMTEPAMIVSEHNYFVDPFSEEPRQSALLHCFADTLNRGLIVWQGKDNWYGDRWRGFRAGSDAPTSESLAQWLRLLGPLAEVNARFVEQPPSKNFSVDQPAFERLALPPSVRIEPLPGADLGRLGLIKKK